MNVYHAEESPAHGPNSPPSPAAGKSGVRTRAIYARARRAGLPVRSLGLDGPTTGLARRHPVVRPEGPAEVGSAREAPGQGDVEDGPVGEARIGEVAPAALQAGVADRLGHRARLVLEQAVEVAPRDVMRAGHGLGRQVAVPGARGDVGADLPAEEHRGRGLHAGAARVQAADSASSASATDTSPAPSDASSRPRAT